MHPPFCVSVKLLKRGRGLAFYRLAPCLRPFTNTVPGDLTKNTPSNIQARNTENAFLEVKTLKIGVSFDMRIPLRRLI